MPFQATVIPVLHDAHVVNAMSLTVLTQAPMRNYVDKECLS